MKAIRAWLLLAVLTLGSVAAPEPIATAHPELEELALEHIQEHRVPGMAVVILEQGIIRYRGEFGFADRGERTLATTKTLFRLASISKPVTAVGVMKLVEEGKLSLDDDVRELVPEMPEGPPIKVRQLLNHTSGIRHYQIGKQDNGTIRYDSVKDALDLFISDPLIYEPGAQRVYSTHAYTLAARVIEVASGQPFVEYMTENVLSGSMTYERRERPAEDRSALYVSGEGELVLEAEEPQDNSWKDAGGGMESDAESLATWMWDLYQGEIIREDLVYEMWMPTTTADGGTHLYGLGWALNDGLYSHAGAQQGARSFLALDPHTDRVIVILSNYSGHSLGSLARRMLDADWESR
ncbi:MAG: serine hydrolase domain-containing protein [Fimbriimonadaceae bacterium]